MNRPIYMAKDSCNLSPIGKLIMRATPLLILKALPFLLIASSAGAASLPAQSWFNQQGYVGPSGSRIIACHGYGCVRRMAISVDGAWLSRAKETLRAGQGSPDAERQALGEVIRSYTAYLATS